MYIVFAEPALRDQELGARPLLDANFKVQVVSDGAQCRLTIEQQTPDVIILNEDLPGTSPLDMVQWIRSIPPPSRPYIILTSSSPLLSTPLANALHAGADDLIRKPFSDQELLFRVNAITRIIHWAPQLLTHSKKVLDWSGETSLATLNSWRDMHLGITKDLSELLGCTFTYHDAEHPLTHSLAAAQLPLIMIEDNAQVDLAVGMDARSLQNIAINIFGDRDTPQSTLEDMLRELANTLGGALKRAAEADRVNMTTGLPVNINPASFGAPKTTAKRHFNLSSPDHSIHVAVEVELRSTEQQQIQIGELCEGMVLACDLFNANGTILVHSGARLTSSNIARIHQLVSSHLIVAVAAA